MNGLLRVNSPSKGQLANEIESNHPLCSLGVKGGYFLFSDNIATINVPNVSIIIIDSNTVTRHHPLPFLKLKGKKRATTHECLITLD